MSGLLRAIAPLAAVAAVLALRTPAARAEDPRRTVAVLEYRADSTALPDIGGRIAGVLRKRTSLRVLGDAQAQQRYGAELSAAVAGCEGDAGCIGRIGQKLGVTEVVLVGVSELGDVILSVQRIDSKEGVVRSRLAEALAADASPSDDELVGYLGRVLPPDDFVRSGTLAIKVNVAGASITVGGEPRGTSPLPPFQVPAPSRYAIEVAAAGYGPFHAEVAVPPDAEVTVDAELTRPGRAHTPWYAHWYVPVIAGVVVGGAVTTGVVLGTQRDDVPAGGHLE
ncbi:MAG TPA: PEGA domain-containing protein [Kofleriaceae bacterium]|nr:PEGA domain-containing protein [Kofleriaceae bacterium]